MVALDSMIYLNFAALYKIWRPPRNNLSFNLHNMLFKIILEKADHEAHLAPELLLPL